MPPLGSMQAALTNASRLSGERRRALLLSALHLREKQDDQVALSFLSQSAFMLLLG